jgi:hypothetical protein
MMSTSASIVADSPTARSPMVQTRLAGSKSPFDTTSELNSPGVRLVSMTCTPVLVSGPLLVTVTL